MLTLQVCSTAESAMTWRCTHAMNIVFQNACPTFFNLTMCFIKLKCYAWDRVRVSDLSARHRLCQTTIQVCVRQTVRLHVLLVGCVLPLWQHIDKSNVSNFPPTILISCFLFFVFVFEAADHHEKPSIFIVTLHHVKNRQTLQGLNGHATFEKPYLGNISAAVSI